MTKPPLSTDDLLDRLTKESRLLRKSAELQDGRLHTTKRKIYLADLMAFAIIAIESRRGKVTR